MMQFAAHSMICGLKQYRFKDLTYRILLMMAGLKVHKLLCLTNVHGAGKYGLHFGGEMFTYKIYNEYCIKHGKNLVLK